MLQKIPNQDDELIPIAIAIIIAIEDASCPVADQKLNSSREQEILSGLGMIRPCLIFILLLLMKLMKIQIVHKNVMNPIK